MPRRAALPLVAATAHPEERLLLRATDWRAPCEVSSAALAELDDERWRALLALAAQHNVLPLVVSRLDPAAGLLATERRAHLERLRMSFTALDRLQVMLVHDLVAWLGAIDVPFILLKGLALSERLYQRPEERVGMDIDILVRPEALSSVQSVLERHGYRPVQPRFYEERHFHIPFAPLRASGARAVIEVHWDLSPPHSPVRFKVDEWWSGAERASLRCGSVLVPRADHALAHLSWHAFNKGLVTLRDLGDVIRSWYRAVREGRAHEGMAYAERTSTPLFLGKALECCAGLWGMEVVEGVDGAEIAGHGEAARVRGVGRSMLTPHAILRQSGGRSAADRKILYWSLLPRASGTLSFLVSDVIRDVDGQAALEGRQPRALEILGALGRLVSAAVRQAASPSRVPERVGSERRAH